MNLRLQTKNQIELMDATIELSDQEWDQVIQSMMVKNEFIFNATNTDGSKGKITIQKK